MQIKIFNQGQLAILRNINPLLKDYKIPRMVLHEIGYILEYKKSNEKDFVVLFMEPIKNDIIDILDSLYLCVEDVDISNNSLHTINVKGKKHPMKKGRVWSWYRIFVPSDNRTIFVVYSMKKKHLKKRGGF